MSDNVEITILEPVLQSIEISVSEPIQENISITITEARNGTDGVDGQDSISPLLQAESSGLTMSIDGGITYQELVSYQSIIDSSTIQASKVGLGNVDDTPDLNKPISTATQTALDLKLNISSLNSLSSNWQNSFNTVSTLSSKWTNASNALTALSGNWQNTFNTLTALSGNWQTTYNTLSTKANLNGGNTLSGNQVLIGTLSATGNFTGNGTSNTLPNQTASTSDSIMTRGLFDSRLSATIGTIQRVVATTDQLATGSGTTYDTALSGIMLSAGSTYKLDVHIKLQGTTGSIYNGQLLGTFTTTVSSSTLLYERAGFNTENSVQAAHPTAFASFSMYNGTGASSQLAKYRGTITPTTGGQLYFYFTNGSATGTTTRVAGSYMEVIKIS